MKDVAYDDTKCLKSASISLIKIFIKYQRLNYQKNEKKKIKKF